MLVTLILCAYLQTKKKHYFFSEVLTKENFTHSLIALQKQDIICD